MPKIYVANFSVTVSGRLPLQAFERHLPGSVDELGANIAKQVHRAIKEQVLGYYPPLEYFKDNGGVESYLLDAVDQVSDIAKKLAVDGVVEILSPVFSNVKVVTVQCLAYNMPKVRPSDMSSIALLADHYRPNHVKLELALSLIQKTEPKPGMEGGVKKIVLRWLDDIFEDSQATSARFIGTD